MTKTINSIAISETDVYAGTQEGGVWKQSLSEILGEEELYKNKILAVYPNPSSGIINVALDKAVENANLYIYNIAGLKIHSEPFTGKQKTINCNLSSGIYYIYITDGNQTRIAKIADE